MKSKFRVGNRVINNEFGAGTVIGVGILGNPLVEFDNARDGFHDGNGSEIYGTKGKEGHCWYIKNIKPLSNQAIVIYPKGLETIALLKEGKKIIKQASAKCNPSDTYDFNIGAKLAFSRLIDEEKAENKFDWKGFKQGEFGVHCDTEEKANAFLKECDEQGIIWNDGEKTTAKNFYNSCKSDTCYSVYDVSKQLGFSRIGYCKEKGINVINYTSSQPSIREVKRPTEVDEWVKIVNAEKGEKYKNGDIMKITHIALGCRHYGHGFSDYLMEDEYVVLENYQPEETTRPSLSMYTDKELIDELAKRWEDKQ